MRAPDHVHTGLLGNDDLKILRIDAVERTDVAREASQPEALVAEVVELGSSEARLQVVVA